MRLPVQRYRQEGVGGVSLAVSRRKLDTVRMIGKEFGGDVNETAVAVRCQPTIELLRRLTAKAAARKK